MCGVPGRARQRDFSQERSRQWKRVDGVIVRMWTPADDVEAEEGNIAHLALNSEHRKSENFQAASAGFHPKKALHASAAI